MYEEYTWSDTIYITMILCQICRGYKYIGRLKKYFTVCSNSRKQRKSTELGNICIMPIIKHNTKLKFYNNRKKMLPDVLKIAKFNLQKTIRMQKYFNNKKKDFALFDKGNVRFYLG